MDNDKPKKMNKEQIKIINEINQKDNKILSEYTIYLALFCLK